MRAAEMRGLVIALGSACALLWAAAVLAQPDAACNPCLTFKDQGIAARGDDVLARYSPEIARGEWGKVGRSLANDFRASRRVPQGKVRQIFQAELDSMANELERVERSRNAADLIARAEVVEQARFTIENTDVAGEALLFARDFELVIDCTTLTSDARQDLCERAFDANRLLIKYGAKGRDRAVSALNRQVELWDNFNENGYSMMPWELAVNSGWAFKPGSLSPPKWQLVVGHPALGLEIGRPGSKLRRLEVGTFEPIGILLYRKDRRTYVGTSALLVVPSGEDFGYGGMLHLGKSIKAGYVWRKERRLGGAVLSADLYQVITQAPALLRDAKTRVVALRDSLPTR